MHFCNLFVYYDNYSSITHIYIVFNQSADVSRNIIVYMSDIIITILLTMHESFNHLLHIIFSPLS
jgi:hypothetical protein